MDVDGLVMTLATKHGVHAEEAETFAGPIAPIQFTALWFASPRDTAKAAAACMADGIPAHAYLAEDGRSAVVILH